MSLLPTITERLARARADLRMGVGVVLRDGETVIVVIAAEVMSAARLADLRAIGPAPVIALTARRAETLNVPAYDGDLVRLSVPPEADTTWIRALADPADDLNQPMKGPFRPVRDSARDGSAAAHRGGLRLAKDAQVLPAVVSVALDDPDGFARAHDLTVIDLAAAAPIFATTSPMHAVAHARLPLSVSDAGRVHVFRPEDGSVEHYAVEIGRPARDKPVTARLHSACFTGDVIGSLKCDCGPQLRGALEQMGHEGAGILLYLNQEGRGIGLANKMRAYSLQDQGFDTVEANHRLGFEDDERDFRIGASMLRELGFGAVRLMTNNPAKVAMMEETGIEVVERVPLRRGETAHNKEYLSTKARKSGHLL